MSKKQNRQQAGRLDCIRSNAAGIDIASQMHYVAIPEGRDTVNVRRFYLLTSFYYNLLFLCQPHRAVLAGVLSFSFKSEKFI